MEGQYRYEKKTTEGRLNFETVENCFTDNSLSKAFREALSRQGLDMPTSAVVVDGNEQEIRLYSRLDLGDDGPWFSYKRVYPKQPGSERIMKDLDRAQELYREPSKTRHLLEREFRRRGWRREDIIDDLGFYLSADCLAFEDKATFVSRQSGKAEMYARTDFKRHMEAVVPCVEMNEQHSITIDDPLIRYIEDLYRWERKTLRRFSTRRTNILKGRLGHLSPERFLRCVGLIPSSCKDDYRRTYRDVSRCSKWLTRAALTDSAGSYTPPFSIT